MKYAILELLRSNKREYTSGEAVSRQMNVSRTAIWKYINELREEGYEIDSVPRRGYRLVSEPDSLNAYALSSEINTFIVGKKILYFNEVDSTNIRAKEIAAQSPDGTIVVAGKQTSGRGRLGRKWESAEGMGLYMSIILKPDIPPEGVQLITLAASVAVSAALKEVAGADAGIKWPNDIILDGKKVCGILTEMSSEMDRVNYVILGIGINFSQEHGDFPEELKDKAISIKEYFSRATHSGTECKAGCKKVEIARKVFEKLDELYKALLDGKKHEIVDEWKRMSVTIGKEVSISSAVDSYTGKAVDVTEDGRLVVLRGDGSRHEIVSGEISVRGILGYL